MTRVAATLALFVVGGCPSPAQTEQIRNSGVNVGYTSPEAQRTYDEASAAFNRSHWSDAEDLYAKFLTQYPFSSLVPDARYRRAVCLNRLGRFMEARQTLREFLERYPTSEDVPRASEELKYAEAKVDNVPNPPPLPAVNPIPKPAAQVPPEMAAVPPPSPMTGTATSASPALGTLRAAINDARAGNAGALQHVAELLDTQASFVDVITLYTEGDETSPAWPYIAAKTARIYFHTGDLGHAAQAAQRALKVGAGGHPERMQEILNQVALRDNVKPTVIGAIVPLTGRLKTYGEAIQEGLTLALGKTQGITLLVKDSQGEPELAAAAVDALVQEGAIVIVGPVGSAESSPAALRAQELGVPMISLSRVEGLTSVGPYVFRNSLTNSAQGKALAHYVTQVLGAKNAGILAPDIPSGMEVTQGFWHSLQEAGGEVRGYETYPQDQTTFKHTIQRLVPHAGAADKAEIEKELAGEKNEYRRKKKLAKLRGSGGHPVVDFDVLLIPDYYKSVLQIAPALKVEDLVTDACQHRGKTPPYSVTLLGTAGWDSPDLIARGLRDVQCAVIVDGFYAESSREPTKKFVADFSEQFKHAPTLLHAQAFDSGSIARDLILNVHPATRDAFRQALGALHDFPGATGTTTFGPDREADKPLFFLTVDRTGFSEMDVAISPAGLVSTQKGAAQP